MPEPRALSPAPDAGGALAVVTTQLDGCCGDFDPRDVALPAQPRHLRNSWRGRLRAAAEPAAHRCTPRRRYRLDRLRDPGEAAALLARALRGRMAPRLPTRAQSAPLPPNGRGGVPDDRRGHRVGVPRVHGITRSPSHSPARATRSVTPRRGPHRRAAPSRLRSSLERRRHRTAAQACERGAESRGDRDRDADPRRRHRRLRRRTDV